jgi:biopolymer transport protein ExbB/TolQ
LLASSELVLLIDTLVRREKRKLEKRLSLLSAIGSTAPYIGLLGTVVGIIDAFQAIALHNNMSPSVVSGGISSALIATAAGLVVAIPAVFAHNLILAAVRRQAELWEEIRPIAQEIGQSAAWRFFSAPLNREIQLLSYLPIQGMSLFLPLTGGTSSPENTAN